MITCCNECGTKFEVSPDLVYSSDPSVRCGECMNLFDARLNIYNEAESKTESARYKPVQKKRFVERIDPEVLENADTVAIEHESLAHDYSNTETRSRASELAFSPEINLSGERQLIDEYPEHRVREHAMDGSEFERTLALDSSPTRSNLPKSDPRYSEHGYSDPGYPNTGYSEHGYSEHSYRDTGGDSGSPRYREPGYNKTGYTAEADYDAGKVVSPHPHEAPQSPNQDHLSKEERTKRRLKDVSERERRALDIESRPKQESGRAPAQGPAHRSDHSRKEARIDDRDLAEFIEVESPSAKTQSAGTSSGTDKRYGFIPEDLLRDSTVLRDNGRREEQKFASDTPRFDVNLDGKKSQPSAITSIYSDSSSIYADSMRLPNVHDRNRDYGRDRGLPSGGAPVRDRERLAETNYGSGSNRKLGPDRNLDRNPGRNPGRNNGPRNDNLPGNRSEHRRPSRQEGAHETSAREMRRYTQARPMVEVTESPSDLEERRRPKTRKRGFGVAWLLIIALAVIFLCLYAARNVIANMNLPESVIGRFCNVTGCVPNEVRQDVSQLRLMRKALVPHPEIDKALVISIDLVNQSVYKQPFPVAAVTLLDAQGEAVAQRSFTPADYDVVDRGDSEFLLPGEPTRVKIEVIDSGFGATDMELEFK